MTKKTEKRIFVFENDPYLLEIVIDLLQSYDYSTMGSNNTATVLDQIASFDPHAILLDVQIANDKGSELCKLLQHSPVSSATPIIVFSTDKRASVLEKVCADAYIEKPFDIYEFISTVERQLNSL